MYNDVYNQEQYAYTYGTALKWLQRKIAGDETASFFYNNGLKRIAIYGINGLGELLYADIRSPFISGGPNGAAAGFSNSAGELKKSEIMIDFFVDKKYREYASGYHGIPVIGLDEPGIKQDAINALDAIVVTPVYYFNEIVDALHTKGVPYEKIVSLNMLFTE
jgi:hypothetical protein